MGRRAGIISAEMRFIYQVVVSCLKLNLDTKTSIKILNNLIKKNGIDYEYIDLKRYTHIKYMVGVHLRQYRKLEVEKSNYKNPRLRALFYQLQMQTEPDGRLNQTSYQTDSLVKQELNNIFDIDNKYENKRKDTTNFRTNVGT